jgi:hypothetical protein
MLGNKLVYFFLIAAGQLNTTRLGALSKENRQEMSQVLSQPQWLFTCYTNHNR